MKKYISILILHLLASMTFAQTAITKKEVTGKAKNLYERAVEYSNHYKYDKAKSDLQKVISIAPNFVDAYIKYGAILYDEEDYTGAETSFEKVIALKADYKPNVYYMLALTEAKMEKYDEAAIHLEAYLASDHKSERQRERAAAKIEMYRFTAEAMKNPVPFEPIKMGMNVNSDYHEYLPSLSADEETLVFTRRLGKNEDLFFSEKKDGEWGIAIPIDEINTPYSEGAQCISADGKTLVFASNNRNLSNGGFDLFICENRNGLWTKPKNIGEPINTRFWETQPSLSADGKTLYFISDRGNKDNSDIYVSKRNENGTWSSPKNLGSVVNSNKDEQTPFIHPDGQTLYFNSNGHPGMGKQDIFFSRKQADGTWSSPQNIGYPINTSGNEGAFITSLDGKTAFFFTDKDPSTGEKNSSTDLYNFPLYEAARPQPVTYVKAQVSDAETGKKLVANVDFVDLGIQKTHTSSMTDLDGEFLVCLPMGKNYGLNVSKEGYLFHSENFELGAANSLEKPYILDIQLQKISESMTTGTPSPADSTTKPVASTKPIILKNIFFETGSADLRQESVTELNRLKNLLETHPNMRIQINGHTDNVGNDTNNQILSENRAKAVYEWLVAHQIAAKRLQFKGFGESQPIETNDTQEGRQANRRTEFVVL